jgi:hypothetical protein
MIELAECDEDVFAALERMTQFGPALPRVMISDGVAHGSLASGLNPDLLVDMLIGPLYHDRLDDTHVGALVQRTIAPFLLS